MQTKTCAIYICDFFILLVMISTFNVKQNNRHCKQSKFKKKNLKKMSEQVATMLNSFTRVSFYTYMSYVPPIDTAMAFIHLTLIDNGFAT